MSELNEFGVTDDVAWCPSGHMIEVEGGHGDFCAACERDALGPPPGWLGEPPYCGCPPCRSA